MRNNTISSKLLLKLGVFLFLAFLHIGNLSAQERSTDYDDLLMINKSYKPAYDETFPDWAKLLYKTPINFNEVNSGFETYMASHEGEKSPITRYYKIWSRAVSEYVLSDGSIQLPDMNEVRRTLLTNQLESGKHASSAQYSNSDWTFLGPKETFWLNELNNPGFVQQACPWQVNIYSFDVAGSDYNTIYCGTETGFVNKTTDKGNSWSVVGQGYPFGGSVTSVAVHPVNPGIVYVSAGNQVHKTTDGGATWTPVLPVGSQFASDKLKIDPLSPNTIYAAANEGIFVSADAGATWQKKWNDPAYDLEIKPGNSNVIYAITRKNTGYFSLVVSTNGGQSFTAETSFPAAIAESSGGLLAVTAANPNKLFAVMLSANDTPYLYRGLLTNSTWTWTLVATGKTAAFPMTNYQGFFDLVLDVSPINENIVLTGTGSFYRSVNGGTNFSLIGGYGGNIPVHPDIQDLKMLPNGESWVSTDGGLTYTTDNFVNPLNSKAFNNGIVGSDMWGFDQGWNEDLVVGGRYHNGNTAIFESYGDKALRMGGAESPTGWVLQGRSRHVAYNDLGMGWILPSYAEGNAEGRFSFSKYPNMEEYGGRRSNMAFHTNYYNSIILGEGSSLWKSSDMGVTFDLLHTFNDKVMWFQLSYSNPKVMYVDVVGKGLYRSSNGGETWIAKPKLTDGTAGTSYWNGKLFFSVSPNDENTIYACLQNGTWSADEGKIFKSSNGGTSWTNWTGSLTGIYTKCLVIQPANDGSDIVYLFTTSRNGEPASVYYRDQVMSDWAVYNTNYPAGMSVNLALPFFRDSKLRVAGSGSVWESPMVEPDFKQIINPWVEKPVFDCIYDTLHFDDHSIINHTGVTWKWEITPVPAYISDENARNPKVVLGAIGNYTVTLSVTRNGQVYSKTIPDMVSATSCPSIDDCNNPAELPKSQWSLVYVDSEETGDPGLAIMSFDDNPATIWHTEWSTGEPPYPHEIQVDLGSLYQVHKFTYLTRQDGGENGRIKDYELYVSEDSTNWGTAVSTGSFINTEAPQTITLATPKVGRFFRLKALSEVNGNKWASAAEFSIVGCKYSATGKGEFLVNQFVSAYPIPAKDLITLELPDAGANSSYKVSILSVSGQLLSEEKAECSAGIVKLDVSRFESGVYLISLADNQGVRYRVKVVKE